MLVNLPVHFSILHLICERAYVCVHARMCV